MFALPNRETSVKHPAADSSELQTRSQSRFAYPLAAGFEHWPVSSQPVITDEQIAPLTPAQLERLAMERGRLDDRTRGTRRSRSIDPQYLAVQRREMKERVAALLPAGPQFRLDSPSRMPPSASSP